MNDSGVILCDLVCPKCGKTGTVYVNNSWEDEIIEIASKRKYFNLPQYAVLTEREFMNQLAVNDL